MILETPRLLLRELVQNDWAALAQMLQDPAVMYAYEHTFTDADVQDWLDRQRRRYATYGFGLWSMVDKATGRMIGQAGLTMQPYRGGEVLEVGYLLQKAHWHHGYATEAAAGCMRYAFERLHAGAVYSVIKTDNAASIRVAERNGMVRVDEFVTQYYNGPMRHYLYRAQRAD